MRGMRIAVLGVALSFGGGANAGDAPPPPAVPSSELVKAGAVWDPPADPLSISLAADGTISLLGHEVGLEELRADLCAKAREPRLRNPDGTSKIDVVLRVAPTLPWTIVQWTMQVCADPNVRIYRLHFAVMPEAGGEEGVIPTFLPTDGPHWEPPPIQQSRRVRAILFASPGTADRGSIFAALKASLDATTDKTVDIVAPPPKIPRAGHVIEVVDLAYRAGAKWIEFEGASMPVSRREIGAPNVAPVEPAPGSLAWLRSWALAQRKATPEGVKVKVGGAIFEGAPGAAAKETPLPPPPPRHVRASGLEEPTSLPPESLPPVEEEPPTPDVVAKEPTVKDPVLEEPPTAEPANPFASEHWRSHLFRGRADRLSGKSAIPADPKADAAIESALAWLAAHQSADGGWEAAGFGGWCNGKQDETVPPDVAGKARYDVGTTGLALLSFLGAGYTNRSEPPYGKVVGRGLRYLRNVQDGEGCFGPRTSGHYNYGHAIATLAMVEAYGMSKSSVYKTPAQKALDFVALARNPYFAWRYGIKPGDNDTSVTGWMALALRAAAFVNTAEGKEGATAPFVLDEDAFEGVSAWIDKMTDPDTGRVGYQQRGSGPARPMELVATFPAERSESMTAIGVLLRVLAGEDPATGALVKKGAKLIAALPPVWDPKGGSIDLYYWQAGALAMAQVGGADAEAWRAALAKALVEHQRTEGQPCGVRGSWDPTDPWGSDGGRVYMTAMAALALEAPYRYPRVAAMGK